MFAWLAGGSFPAVWPFVLVGVVVGSANSLFGIAGSAILPQIAGGKSMVRANALAEAGDALMTVAGPAIAGAVIARFNTATALVIDALTFLAAFHLGD